MKPLFHLPAWFGLSLLLGLTSACSMNDLRKQINEAENTLRIARGQVVYDGELDENTSIILAVMDENLGLQGYKLLPNPQDFESIIFINSSLLFAFADTNHDRVYQPGEPAATSELVQSPDKMHYRQVTLKLNKNTQAPGTFRDLYFLQSKTDNTYNVQYGTVTTIDNPQFNSEVSKMGMWEPLRFLKEGYGGVYLLQEYSANKTPILFVHGIDGNPAQFKKIIDAFDSDKYQFLVFYYPSGFRLHTLGNGLYGILAELNTHYNFYNLHLVAHSMGGLVSRDFLGNCGRRGGCDYLGHYVSIATPYSGHKSAQMGVDYAPVVMPVWKDMAPKSQFIDTLFDTPRPLGVDHHLFFGFDNGGGGESGDGVIDMSSQLRPEAQSQSTSVSGYNDTHVGLLSNEQLIQELVQFINQRSP